MSWIHTPTPLSVALGVVMTFVDLWVRRLGGTWQPDECGAFDYFLSSAVEPALGGTDYTATIDGAADYGTATTSAGASGTDCAGYLYAEYGSFLESFDQSLAPHGPATAADCKDGGYASYGTAFKNEGQCVSFVEHATKSA